MCLLMIMNGAKTNDTVISSMALQTSQPIVIGGINSGDIFSNSICSSQVYRTQRSIPTRQKLTLLEPCVMAARQ